MLCVYIFVQVSAGSQKAEAVRYPQGVEGAEIVSHQIPVLGIKLRSSVVAMGAHNCWDISLVQWGSLSIILLCCFYFKREASDVITGDRQTFSSVSLPSFISLSVILINSSDF